ncbi:hypothetical protein B0H34DRAFT_671681 [Crassisporium funariophilum]|nr:hypothetical protein B0H34DRAFT_671681 [Crassisporium funariophilum]
MFLIHRKHLLYDADTSDSIPAQEFNRTSKTRQTGTEVRTGEGPDRFAQQAGGKADYETDMQVGQVEYLPEVGDLLMFSNYELGGDFYKESGVGSESLGPTKECFARLDSCQNLVYMSVCGGNDSKLREGNATGGGQEYSCHLTLTLRRTWKNV